MVLCRPRRTRRIYDRPRTCAEVTLASGGARVQAKRLAVLGRRPRQARILRRDGEHGARTHDEETAQIGMAGLGDPPSRAQWCTPEQQDSMPIRHGGNCAISGSKCSRASFVLTRAALPLSSTPCTANTLLARSISNVIMLMDFTFRGFDDVRKTHHGTGCRLRLAPQPRGGEVPLVRQTSTDSGSHMFDFLYGATQGVVGNLLKRLVDVFDLASQISRRGRPPHCIVPMLGAYPSFQRTASSSR